MSSQGKGADKLVYMANQIGKFFATQKQGGDVDGVATHIRKFWDPRMRAAIFAHLDAGGAGLDPLALQALRKLKAEAAQVSGAHPAADAVIEPSG
ncbi:MAG: formate dehydrogenase subunit delta [Proteobacteria bacterium]|nr:formate dehydrogenase subunit delta [Pseudomonadota bacterium]